MALTVDTDVPMVGLIVNGAYVNIMKSSIQKVDGQWQTTFFISFYKSEMDYIDGNGTFKMDRYSCNIDIDSTDNVVTQIYNHLKSLPEFIDAVDA